MTKRMQIAEFQIPEGKELLEDSGAEFFALETALEEDKETGEKKAKLRGRFGQTDEATANKRLYPRKVMEREIKKLLGHITEGQMFGELDHPGDGKTKLARVSHMITGLKIEDNGQISGELVIIPGTHNGDQALAIAKAGGKLGISSRGFGTTVPDTKGNYVVQEDYTLVSFDIVADPANAGAYPDYVVEHKEVPEMQDLKTLRKEQPELVESIERELNAEARDHARAALREEMEDKLVEAVDALREEALKEATRELLSDPEVAGAKSALKGISKLVRPFILREDEESMVSDLEARLEEAEKRVAEADDARQKAVSEAEELGKLAKEAFFHLYLERTLHGDDRREQVESLLGDLLAFENLDELSERVSEVRNALAEEDARQTESDDRVAQLEAEKALLAEQLEKSLMVGNQLAVKALIERKVGRHPQADKIRVFLNECNPSTREEVDALVEEFDEQFPVSPEYSQIRNDLRLENEDEVTGRRTPLEEDDNEGGNVLGVDMGILAEASGIPQNKG